MVPSKNENTKSALGEEQLTDILQLIQALNQTVLDYDTLHKTLVKFFADVRCFLHVL